MKELINLTSALEEALENILDFSFSLNSSEISFEELKGTIEFYNTLKERKSGFEALIKNLEEKIITKKRETDYYRKLINFFNENKSNLETVHYHKLPIEELLLLYKNNKIKYNSSNVTWHVGEKIKYVKGLHKLNIIFKFKKNTLLNNENEFEALLHFASTDNKKLLSQTIEVVFY